MNMRSAVLFVIFKRPDTTKRVFECIREAKPPRLYIAADGPREDRPEEIEKCKETREISYTVIRILAVVMGLVLL